MTEATRDQSYPRVKLTGEDGNAFAIIGRVSNAMIDAGLPDEALAFRMAAFRCKSYDEVLQLCAETVEVV